jgi:hypothetical protein
VFNTRLNDEENRRIANLVPTRGDMLTGINHIATVSKDLDSLIVFYDRIFGAKVLLDVTVPDMVLKSARGRAATSPSRSAARAFCTRGRWKAWIHRNSMEGSSAAGA